MDFWEGTSFARLGLGPNRNQGEKLEKGMLKKASKNDRFALTPTHTLIHTMKKRSYVNLLFPTQTLEYSTTKYDTYNHYLPLS